MIKWICYIIFGFLLFMASTAIWVRVAKFVLPHSLAKHFALIGYIFSAIIVFYGAPTAYRILASVFRKN